MKEIVINTTGYATNYGFADRITLPGGKYFFVGIDSILSMQAKAKGWDVQAVEYFGACGYSNINIAAHEKTPIQIDDESVADFLHLIATEKEYATILTEHGLIG